MNIYKQNANLIFYSIKQDRIKDILENSKGGGEESVLINRNQAARLETNGKVDEFGEHSVFGQLMQQLKASNFSMLRQNNNQFSVDFKGEGSIDCGGPFNECIA